ncbi:hypothetical protein MRX96_010494 [Rhipicephalus microplus]
MPSKSGSQGRQLRSRLTVRTEVVVESSSIWPPFSGASLLLPTELDGVNSVAAGAPQTSAPTLSCGDSSRLLGQSRSSQHRDIALLLNAVSTGVCCTAQRVKYGVY